MMNKGIEDRLTNIEDNQNIILDNQYFLSKIIAVLFFFGVGFSMDTSSILTMIISKILILMSLIITLSCFSIPSKYKNGGKE